MKRKTIKSHLAKIHKAFVESIEDDNVQNLVRKNSIITGGSIVSMLLKEPVNDYDYYFANKETVEAVAHYYVNKFNELHPDKEIKPRVVIEEDRVRIRIQSAGVASENDPLEYQYFETRPEEEAGDYLDEAFKTTSESTDEDKPAYRPIFLTDNAISLSNKIQLVIRFYGSPEEIHDNYDFVHAMNWWRSDDGHLELPPKALEAILAKELVYHGSKYPLASLIRARKFIKRGWSINAGQYLKMSLQLGELDLKNITVLEDQLIGMDAAYFNQVIELIRKRQEEDNDFKLTSAYLVEIIDRLF